MLWIYLLSKRKKVDGRKSVTEQNCISISPKTMGGCRGVKLADKLQQYGFKVESREYFQQMLFPPEVILVYK